MLPTPNNINKIFNQREEDSKRIDSLAEILRNNKDFCLHFDHYELFYDQEYKIFEAIPFIPGVGEKNVFKDFREAIDYCLNKEPEISDLLKENENDK